MVLLERFQNAIRRQTINLKVRHFVERLRSIVNDTDTFAGRVFDWAVLALIVVAIVEFSFETLPGFSSGTIQMLQTVEIVITVLFTLEYAVRVLVAQPARSYIFSFYGIIDLLAILPFYLSLGLDLRAVRALVIPPFMMLTKSRVRRLPVSGLV